MTVVEAPPGSPAANNAAAAQANLTGDKTEVADTDPATGAEVAEEQ